MEQSPRLSLSYVAPSQAQKHVTVNETFRRLDALVQGVVLSRTTAAEPASPAEGEAYILPSGASGAVWSGYAAHDLVAYQDGAWALIAPFEGLRVWVSDDDELVIYDGAAWAALSGGEGGSSESAAKFGVNTTADATNRLAVKSDAVLFNHDDVTPGSGDCQVKINKDAAGDTGALLFQTGASGRAELGLAGDDDFQVKVSADGAVWTQALVIDKDDGNAGFREKLFVNGASGTVSGTSLTDLVVGTGVYNAGAVIDVGAASVGRVTFSVAGVATTVGASFQYSPGAGASGQFSIQGRVARTDFIIENSDGSVIVGNPTGGAKGAGTINAEGFYDDNSLLSCYVFDQALDGAVDAAKWDARVPDRRIRPEQEEAIDENTGASIIRDAGPARIEPRAHEPMRKFAARIGTDYDPLTLDGYARHWKEKRHLSAMPNEAVFDPERGLAAGEWIQRLVETVEIQAVLIEELNARVKALAPRGRQ